VPEVVAVPAATRPPTPDLASLVYLGRRARLREDGAEELAQALRHARVVVVVGMLRPAAVRILDELLDTGDFEIVEHTTRRGGYAVLRHRLGQPTSPPGPRREVTFRRSPHTPQVEG
jgi:hypothetical protein